MVREFNKVFPNGECFGGGCLYFTKDEKGNYILFDDTGAVKVTREENGVKIALEKTLAKGFVEYISSDKG
jgi:hypothetical protein